MQYNKYLERFEYYLISKKLAVYNRVIILQDNLHTHCAEKLKNYEGEKTKLLIFSDIYFWICISKKSIWVLKRKF